MWAGPPQLDGTYDVDDYITGFVRTEGPTITINGAWAQNIGVDEMYVDFMGTKAGVRFQYNDGEMRIYSTSNGALTEIVPKFTREPMFEKEIDAFLTCIDTGEKLPSHIDTVLITAKMMQAMYDSSEQGREIVL